MCSPFCSLCLCIVCAVLGGVVERLRKMKYLVTAAEMKRYDENTIEKIGIPGMVLMERAALAAFEALNERFTAEKLKNSTVLVLAGMGNNGGDGLALARLLGEAGCKVDVWCVGDEAKASKQWKCQRDILQNYPVRISCKPEKEEYNILIDALFGVGLSREIGGVFLEAVEYFNALSGFKLALDIPSGVCSDTGRVLGCAVKTDMTVTFAFEKRGLALFPGCEYGGRVITADIGITERAFFGQEPQMFYYDEEPVELLPNRCADSNKGSFGKVLLIAGSVNMAGAAVLSARSAYRAGAGMVKVISPEENRIILQQAVPEALFGTIEDLEESLKWADVIAIGPGLSQGEQAFGCLEKVILESRLPLLIDADGLNLLAKDRRLKECLSKQGAEGRSIIVTPHVGELARLLKQPVVELKTKLADYGKSLADSLHCVVVAKDAKTFTCRENAPICVNLRGNSGMATAGSGDVLAGIIAGLLAQGMEPFRAAAVGVSIHAWAGDQAAKVLGEHACMAGDIIMHLRKKV